MAMAFAQLLTLLLFAMGEARFGVAASQVLKAKVSCLDCTTHNYDLSEIKVSVNCEKVKKVAVATTEEDGSFKVDLPRDPKSSSSSSESDVAKCVAELLGGPNQLYASRKNKLSLIVKAKEPNSFTISNPLAFLTACPTNTNCKAVNQFASSKTFDLPLPPEWGLAPSSYYFPFFPIIGIP